MTKAEIKADTASCLRAHPSDDTPRQGKPRTRYAMVQLSAGTAGPVGKPTRVLIVHDDIGAWYYKNGRNWGWSRGDLHADGTGPAAGMNFGGGTNIGCGKGAEVVDGP